MQDQLQAIFGIKDHVGLGQECARAVLIFFYGLVMLRLSGRRTFSSMSAVDMVVSIIVGSGLSRVMTGAAPFVGTFAAIAVLAALHVALSYAVAASAPFSRLVEGKSIRLATDGVIDERARLTCKISMTDLEQALREHGIEGLGALAETKKLVLEPSGRISVLKT